MGAQIPQNFLRDSGTLEDFFVIDRHNFSKVQILVLAFILIFIINLISFYVLKTSYDNTLEQVKSETKTNSYLVSQWILESFKIPKLILQQLTSNTKPHELIYPIINQREHDSKTALVKDLSKLSDKILFLGLFDKNCVITHTSIGVNLGRNLKNYPYCGKAFEKPYEKLKTSNMSVSSTNQMNVTVTYPVMENKNTMVGFGLIGLDLYFFQHWLDKLISNEANKDIAISIFDLNRMLLARVPFVKKSIGKRLDNKILEEFTNSKNTSEMSIHVVSPIDGVDRVWTFRKIENLPFVIVVGLPVETAMDKWRVELSYFIIANFLFIILILFTAYKFIQNKSLALKMEKLAITDKLTGIYNRTKLEDVLSHELARGKRYLHKVGLIIIDIDYFKQVNDTYGHQVGDSVLCDFSNLLKNSCRLTDIVGRWGGEEFFIITPEADKNGIIKLAESIRKIIEKYHFPGVGQKTASFGVSISADGDEVEDFIKRADEALYEAKESGRNKVRFHSINATSEAVN
ncbi:MAG: GGDEF domain-containing protein [Reinekea sp.]